MGSLAHVEVYNIRSFQKQNPSFSQRLEDDESSEMIRKRVIFGHLGFSQVDSVWQVCHCRHMTMNCYCVCSTVARPRLSLIGKVPKELD